MVTQLDSSSDVKIFFYLYTRIFLTQKPDKLQKKKKNS